MPEPDSLVYQENLARSKRFIVPLIIGAIWGWLTGPVIVPSPFSPLAFNGTSNQTTRDTDEDRFKPKARSFSLFGFMSDLLSGSFAARAVLGAFEPEAVPKAQLEVAPRQEKRTLAIFDLVSGALIHWILPEGLIKNTDELANQTSLAFTPLSIQLIQASRNVVSIQT